jgi:beta-glucosidase
MPDFNWSTDSQHEPAWFGDPTAEPGGFRDLNLPVPARIDDLVDRLTLEEKVGLLHQHQAPVERLGIGVFRTGTEALHGLAWLGPATVFTQAVGLAATWSPELVREVGAAVGDETRGFYHKDPARGGLNVWAPVVNLLRDPRWGRNEEGYSEDPLLTAQMGVAYSSGLRGDHPTYLRTAPTLKHFLAYNNETRRDQTSSGMPPRVLHEYELPAYRAALATGAAVAVMGSYNLINGRPAHLSPLVNDTLRRWADDHVLVVSDAEAPSNVVQRQDYYPDHATSFAALVKAGVDSFTDGDADSARTTDRLFEALRRGLLHPSDVDTAVRRILSIRFRLGEFDPPEANPYAAITEEVINCPAHQALALEAARQSIVLLKNTDSALPLDPTRTRRVAVIGPSADSLYEDWYSGTLPYAVTARRGIAERLGADATVTFAEGIDRVAFRVSATDSTYLIASENPDGAALTAEPAPDGAGRIALDDATPLTAGGANAHFDLLDWGNDVWALRAAANGKFVMVDDAGALINSAAQPNGWVVRETFTVQQRGAEVVLKHLSTGHYVVVNAEGVRASGTVEQATGFTLEPIRRGIDEAVAAAAAADVVIAIVGNHPMINGRETEDRVDIALPPAQDELVRAVYAANPRTTLIVMSSYPYGIGWAQENLPAIIWSAHGGQEFGRALAEVIFGDTAPAGRLPQTWYRSAAELPNLLDYDIIGSDATYLYHRGTPLYPFGHGLTYAPFEYSGLALSTERVDAPGSVEVRLELTNAGDRDSDEVVQLYTRQRRSRVKQPLRQLRGFTRVRVPAGATTTVVLQLRIADLAFWDVTSQRYVVETARHDVLIGRSSTDIRLTATLDVDGDSIAGWDPRRPMAAPDADGYADIELVDATKTTGDAVQATHAGGWVVFEGVRLGDVTGCTGELSDVERRDSTVRLRLDDPIDGVEIATLTADGAGDRYAWTTVSAPVSGADEGRHDLYAVFDTPGTCLRALTFTEGGES